MGFVNVVRPDGSVVPVDEETYKASKGGAGHRETTDEEQARLRKEDVEKKNTGLSQTILAPLVGAADSALGHLPSTLAGAQEHPYVSGMRAPDNWGAEFNQTNDLLNLQRSNELSTTLGGLLPDLVMGGGVRHAVEEGALSTFGKGVATKAVARGAKAAGTLAEGAFLADKAAAQKANISGDPLTVEGALVHAGIGGLLNLGIDALAGKLLGAGAAAKSKLTQGAAAKEAALSAKAEAERGLAEAQDALLNAKTASVRVERAPVPQVPRTKVPPAATEAEGAAAVEPLAPRPRTPTPFSEPRPPTPAEEEVSRARDVVARGAKMEDTTPSWGDLVGTHNAAHKASAQAVNDYAAASDEYQRFLDDGINDFLDKDVSRALNRIREAAQKNAASAGEVEIAANKADFIRGIEERKSRALKLWSGGREVNGGRWSALDESIAPNREAAFDEVLSIKRDLEKAAPAGSSALRELPARPVAPDALESVALPKNPMQLADYNDDMLLRVATTAEKNPQVAAAWGRVMDDLGLQRTGDTLQDIINMRTSVQDYTAAVGRVASADEAAAAAKAAADQAEKAAKKAAAEAQRATDRAARAARQAQKDATAEARANDAYEFKQAKQAAAEANRVAHEAEAAAKEAKAAAVNRAKAAEQAAKQKLKDATKAAAGFGEEAARPSNVVDFLKQHAAKRAVTGALGAVFGSQAGLNPWASGLAGVLLGNRAGTREGVTEMVAKWAPRAGSAVQRLGPVTSWLSGHLLTGEKDDEGDVRKQAVKRIDDTIRASQLAPDAAYVAVRPLLGDESGVGEKLHEHVTTSMRYLADRAPKDPGLDTDLKGSNWTPTYAQTLAWAHTIEAVMDPVGAIKRALQGDGHPAATQALWDRYPALMQETAMEVAVMADRLGKVSYEGGAALKNLFRVPVTGLQQPAVIASLQGLYLPQPSAPQGPPPPRAPQPNGRPAAVQSPVAGSSVNNLIS